MSQNRDVFLLKVLPLPGILLCVSLLKSHLRNISSCFAELSILGVTVLLQLLQNHRCDPDLFFPYLIQIPLQTGQIKCFIYPPEKNDSKEDITPIQVEISMVSAIFTNAFCPPYILFQKRYNGCNRLNFNDYSRFYQRFLSYKPLLNS